MWSSVGTWLIITYSYRLAPSDSGKIFDEGRFPCFSVIFLCAGPFGAVGFLWLLALGIAALAGCVGPRGLLRGPLVGIFRVHGQGWMRSCLRADLAVLAPPVCPLSLARARLAVGVPPSGDKILGLSRKGAPAFGLYALGERLGSAPRQNGVGGVSACCPWRLPPAVQRDPAGIDVGPRTGCFPAPPADSGAGRSAETAARDYFIEVGRLHRADRPRMGGWPCMLGSRFVFVGDLHLPPLPPEEVVDPEDEPEEADGRGGVAKHIIIAEDGIIGSSPFQRRRLLKSQRPPD